MNANSRPRRKDRPWQQGGDQPSTFGQWLRRQREAREISLREIADSSRISLRYLEAFEQDRFDVLPARVFAQGFLREYAKYVGMDPDEVVNHFLSAQQAVEPEDEEGESGKPRRSGSNWLFNLVLIAAVVATLVLTALIAFRSERSRSQKPPTVSPLPAPTAVPPATAEPPATNGATPPPAATSESAAPTTGTAPSDPAAGAVVPAPAAPDTTTPATEPAGAAAAPGTPPAVAAAPGTTPAGAEPAGAALTKEGVPLRIVLRFNEDCWAQIDVDGSRRVQRQVPSGETLAFDARQAMTLTLGNAGGVEVLVNGRRFELGKGRGQVARDVRIDLSAAQAPATSPPAAGTQGTGTTGQH